MQRKSEHVGTQSVQTTSDAIECRWEEPDPYACLDERSCGCYTDPCTLYGVDPGYCMDDPCTCCC